MAHARRKFFDVHTTLKSPLAAEVLDRTGKLYEIERQIHGHEGLDHRYQLAGFDWFRQVQLKARLSGLHPIFAARVR